MKRIAFYCFVLMTIFTSCNKATTNTPDVTNTIVLPAAGSSVVSAGNKMAFDFFKATLQQDATNNNKLVSPLSIYLALSMVYNGANGDTKDSISKTLELSGIDINNLNDVCNALITQLPQEDNKVTFSIANSIWYNKNSFQPLPTFLSTVQNDYAAEATPLEFGNPSVVNTINNWVTQKTNNKITKIFNATSADDLMYLINAIYFNASWKYAFQPSATYTAGFYLPDGSNISTLFMTQQLTVKHYSDSTFQMIELPYGGGNSCSMYLMLPANNGQPISTFASLMNNDILQNAISKMDSLSLKVIIPSWEYSYNIDDMKPALTSLHMGIAFGDGADFSNMFNPSQTTPYITKAVHKTYIKVNEAGTEAAAVTGFGIGVTSSLPMNFTANRPFLYAIIEKQTGSVVFIGIVNNPQEH